MDSHIGNSINEINIFPSLKSIESFFVEKDAPIKIESLSIDQVTSILKNPDSFSFQYIRVSANQSAELMPLLTLLPENVKFLEIFDSLFFENGRWVPRLSYFDILRSVFIKKFKNHRIKESAVIICRPVELLALVNFAVGLGHQRIIIFNDSGELPDGINLGRHIVGIDVKVVGFADITQESENTSLMINTLDLENNANLLSDLAYFNFMSKQGIVLELFSNSPVNPFLFEAEKAELRILSRKEIIIPYEFSTLLKLGLVTAFERDIFFEKYSEIMTIDQ